MGGRFSQKQKNEKQTCKRSYILELDVSPGERKLEVTVKNLIENCMHPRDLNRHDFK